LKQLINFFGSKTRNWKLSAFTLKKDKNVNKKGGRPAERWICCLFRRWVQSLQTNQKKGLVPLCSDGRSQLGMVPLIDLLLYSLLQLFHQKTKNRVALNFVCIYIFLIRSKIKKMLEVLNFFITR
jgi:hypothetical protein